MNSTPDLPDDVLEALRNGHKVEAVRRLRAHHGIGLKQAKQRVERAVRLQPGRGQQGGRGDRGAIDNPVLVEPGPAIPGAGRLLIMALLLAGAFLLLRDLGS